MTTTSTGPEAETRTAFAQATAGTDAQRRLAAQIAACGVERNVAELELYGYTVVPDAAPLELFDRIRDAIVRITQETRDRGVKPFDFGPNTSMMYRLLAHDDVFAEAVLTRKLTALMTYLLGEGYALNVATGSILSQGANAGPLHCDNQFFPEPFPAQYHVAVGIWCCDDFSGELGSTLVVPGSHRRHRHPRAGEGINEAIAVEAPRGSIVIWTGHTWHASGGRTAPGDRIALHTGFSRPHIQPFEGYAPEDVDRLTKLDARLARLLGADLPYSFKGDSPDLDKLLSLAATTQAQA
ncbi:MAG: phytanoyl-CoA dioxygenase family protein [Actinobacteria bacterium]|nr:phytanoyl-CoA dioxygenase family protein [Actinomycetota bacterium]MBV9936042.1 phytanoyl-CoA dioxygenase family protein [Actinomycetota bacterium]